MRPAPSDPDQFPPDPRVPEGTPLFQVAGFPGKQVAQAQRNTRGSALARHAVHDDAIHVRPMADEVHDLPGVVFVEEDFRRIGARLVDVAERHPENGDKFTR